MPKKRKRSYSSGALAMKLRQKGKRLWKEKALLRRKQMALDLWPEHQEHNICQERALFHCEQMAHKFKTEPQEQSCQTKNIFGDSQIKMPIETQQTVSKSYSLRSPFIENPDLSPFSLSSVKIEIDNPEIVSLSGKDELFDFWNGERSLEYIEVKLESDENVLTNNACGRRLDGTQEENGFQRVSLNETVDGNNMPSLIKTELEECHHSNSESVKIGRGKVVRERSYDHLSDDRDSTIGEKDQGITPIVLNDLSSIQKGSSGQSCGVIPGQTVGDEQCNKGVHGKSGQTKDVTADNTKDLEIEQTDKNFTTEQNVAERYVCKVCERFFPSYVKLMCHYIDDHDMCNVFICTLCGKEFNEESDYDTHKETHIEYNYMMDFNTCPVCCIVFLKRDDLDRHMVCHTSAVTMPRTRDFQNECNSSTSMSNGRSHSSKEGSATPTTCHICPVCKNIYESSEDLVKHLSNHEKPYKCGVCNESYFYSGLLQNHMNKHLDNECFITRPECNKACDSEEKFRNRRNTKYNKCSKCNKSNGCNCKKKKEKKEEKTCQIQCNICGKFYAGKYSLNIHMRIHNGIKPYKCTQCGKAFSQQHLLKSHIRMHNGENPYKCNLCDHKAYRHKNSLKVHMQKHDRMKKKKREQEIYQSASKVLDDNFNNSSNTPLNLNDENDTNSNNNNMDINNNDNSDDNEISHWCSPCDKSFKSLPGLKLHIRSHGKEKKVHQCKVCGKISTTKGNLSVHMRIHTGEKPYKCQLCAKTYRQSHLLKYHMTTH